MPFVKAIYNAIIKKFYGKFNGKLFSYVSIPGSYVALAYLLLKKKKNQIIILPANAIGDCIYVFSFLGNLNLYAEKTNSQLIVYASDRYKQLLNTYDLSLKNVVFVKHLGFKHLLLLMLSASIRTQKQVAMAARKQIFAAVPRCYGDYIPKEIVGVRNQLSYLFQVPVTPISYHNPLKEIVSAIDDFDARKDKICIVNPYSCSMSFSQSLYEKICAKLKDCGFAVYTNVCGNQKEIYGTQALRCSIEEFYSIACVIPLIVSVRSGILDFLIPSNVNMFVIYETWGAHFNTSDPKYVADHYSLQEWHSQGNIHEAYMENEWDEDKILDEFDVYLKKLNLGI